MYDRRAGGKTLVFGVSGYLYRNAVLYHDEQTETFWSQMTGKAVVGPLTGERLKWLPGEVTTWAAWKAKHKKTTVLRPLSRFLRQGAYRGTEQYYARYRRGGKWMFPMEVKVDPAHKPFAAMTIITTKKGPRGYLHERLDDGETADGDLTIRRKGDTVTVWGKDGKQVPAITAYWFAWCAFYESGSLYERP